MCQKTTSKESTKSDDSNYSSSKGTTLLPPPKLRLSQFLDPNEPWVLVPDGSYRGYFNNVPEVFRVGPWNIFCSIYLFAIIYWIGLEFVQCYNHPPPPSDYTFYGTSTWQWWYNAAGFLWSVYIAYRVTQTFMGFFSWIAYTLQSWTLIILRHGLSTLVPFFPALAPYNEHLRFAMLLQTTVVFFLWNFALLPAIYMTMKNPKPRHEFLKFCFGFLLIQLRIVNLPLAIMNGVYGSPAQELNQIDFCVALGLALQYVLFYLCVLDRMGIHLYFIFSPRSPLALITWTAFFGCHYAVFEVWKKGILHYGSS